MKMTAAQWKAAEKRMAIPDTLQWRGWLLWRIKVATLERLWKRIGKGYIARGEETAHKDRIVEYMLDKDNAHLPMQVLFQSCSEPRAAWFWNGRHRFAVARDSGVKEVIVAMPWRRWRHAKALRAGLTPVCDRAKDRLLVRAANAALSKKLFAASKRRLEKRRRAREKARRKARQ